MEKVKDNLPLTIPFGLLMALNRIRPMEVISSRQDQSMLIKSKFTIKLVQKYWIMHGKVIIAVFLLTVKQVPENHIV
jgi:hypothetical protein